MVKTAIARLADAIGYPEKVPDDSVVFTLRVDGAEILAEETGGRIVLEFALSEDASVLQSLAGYAAGRMLREEAALAFGSIHAPGHSGPQAFLWQDEDASADARSLLRLFETFMDSCDWWRERVNALRRSEAVPPPEAMMIRP